MGRLTSVIFAALLCIAAGCSSGPPQSTRLTASDHRYTVDETTQKLLQSDWFFARNSSSPRATVTIAKVLNLTSDIIPEPEQWMFVLSVWNSESVKQLARSKNVVTQVTPERLAMIRSHFPDAGSDFTSPTHQLTAVFNTATRTGDLQKGIMRSRMEHYQMEYSLNEVATGTLVWSGIVEFKREAKGNVID